MIDQSTLQAYNLIRPMHILSTYYSSWTFRSKLLESQMKYKSEEHWGFKNTKNVVPKSETVIYAGDTKILSIFNNSSFSKGKFIQMTILMIIHVNTILLVIPSWTKRIETGTKRMPVIIPVIKIKSLKRCERFDSCLAFTHSVVQSE